MSGSVGILADPHGLTGVTPIGQRKLRNILEFVDERCGLQDEKGCAMASSFIKNRL
jgi:hypothetical protein